ncbi:MAG TPA: lipid A export permease/ATP-binding protein MsbA [Rhodanobacteraceae bacterium]|nr:lipid A export permease/ATP-binding protein MsbA [Rhodanobacteraceae bacterium]
MSDASSEVSAWATYRRLLGYLKPYKWVALGAVLGMIGDAGALALFTRLIKPMLDSLFVLRDQFWIFWMPTIIVCIFLARTLAVYAENYGTAYVGRGVVQRMREEIFRHYLRLSSGFFDRESSGHQIARITYTSEQVAAACTDAVKTTVVDSLTVIGMMIVMLLASPWLTLVLLVMVPGVALLVRGVSRRYRRISHGIQGSMGSVTSILEEVVGAHREVKIYGGQRYEDARFEDVTQRNRRLNLKVAATNGVATSMVQLIAAIALAAIVYFATRFKGMTPGTFSSLMLAMGAMLPSLKRLTTVQANLQRGVAAAQDLFAVLDLAPESDSGSVQVSRVRGEIELRDVTLDYGSGRGPALNGISLHCPAGKVTALVGRSGSGKSSLVGMLPRFYEPNAGEILLDGKPLPDYTLENLRSQIAWVGQNVVLFNDTIARNIAYGALESASEAQVMAAAEAANAMEFIAQLPQGIHTNVGDSGSLFSGGQRQRIAIARALLKNAPILILDEATSALDTESERLIQDALSRLMKNRTTLVIAHRLSTVEHADQIAVLDAGRVVEQGTHQELLARGGQYAALHRLQFHESHSTASAE